MRSALLFVFILAGASLRAQFLSPAGGSDLRQLPLDVAFGKLAEGSRSDILTESAPAAGGSHKSPFLAAALSLVIPGLGEYYVGDQIWRGAIFTAVDAGLWYGHFTYLSRGDDSTVAFQAFADANWLPSRYADTLNVLLANIQSGYHINDPDNFTEINRAEDTLSVIIQGFPISHRLPTRGSQQYYELISKYLQFVHGWKDHESGGPSPLYLRHADMRANMNKQYEIADYFLFGLLLDRVLSAIDAVLLTRDHNSPLRLQGELRSMPAAGGNRLVPTAKLRLRF